MKCSSSFRPLSHCLLAAGLGLLASFEANAGDAKLPPPAQRPVDFLKDVRPIFEARCFKCHGPDKQKSSFRLDVKAAALKGGESGQDILPGRSAESPLIHFVSGFVQDKQMPPKDERLSAEQIGLLRAWIDQGAQWPDELDSKRVPDKADFWTFKPAAQPKIPETQDRQWPRNPIDQFLLARMERENLRPSPEADRVTLIRRLSFDLRGLPPTWEEIEAFASDKRSQAYERLVDQLLATPQYGERWARHWLDVVHYGESHGYDKDKPRRNAWPYRDYVIRAFNNDKPYSRFVEEQLAGDILFPNAPEGIVATGFIAAGPWDFVGHVELPESKTDGLIARYNDRDDMVMTTMSTFQSLTVHCARCHDHKFDPISQQEYYNLQAVFAGVDRAERPFDLDPKVLTQRRPLLAEKKRLESRQKELDAIVANVSSSEIQDLDERLSRIKAELKALPKPPKESPGNGYHSGIESMADVQKWVQVDLANSRRIDEVRLMPARPTDFADTPGFGFPKRFRIEIADQEDFSDRRILEDRTGADFPNPGDSPHVVPVKGQSARFIRVTAMRLWQRTQDYVFALAELQVISGTNNVAPGASVAALDSIESGRWAKARLVDNYDSRKPLTELPEPIEVRTKRRNLEKDQAEAEAERQKLVQALLDENTKSERASVSARLKELNLDLEGLPKPQMVYAAANDFVASGNFVPPKKPRPVHLLQRGDVKSPGPSTVPGSLNRLPGLKGAFDLPDSSDEGSRRAALAKWLTHPQNLLTRRSLVNRVWQYHFGRGIVETPNDFGHMGAPPTHPELLDWLAVWFLDHGESFKALHKLILTSSAYRQSSASRPEFARLDADNRWLWRMNRQRLDAECLHDAIAHISGKLDLTMGGPSVQQFFFKDDHSPIYDYTQFDADDPGHYRRSVYRFIVRSVPDPFMECLDCADPSLLTPTRSTTLTALQALSTLNNPFVVKQAEYFAERLQRSRGKAAERIELACKLAWGRAPRPDESKMLLAYATKHGLANACRLLLNSNEFMFVD